jgi:hypothetical protein
MTIASTVAAFQALHGSIAGVNSAPTAMPQSLQAMRLPFVFTWPGPTYDADGWQSQPGGWYTHRRIYIVRCYVKPIAQGNGFDDGYQIALGLLQKFGEAYMGADGVMLGGALEYIGPSVNDTGVRGDMQWVAGSDVYYTGFEFRIETKEKYCPHGQEL